MKKPKQPKQFTGLTDELNHLSDLVRYYQEQDMLDSGEAAATLLRFETILRDVGGDDGSITLQQHWALLHEVRCNFIQAIGHRRKAIEYIEDLFRIGGPIGPVNQSFLHREMRALANDYLQVGDESHASELFERIGQIM